MTIDKAKLIQLLVEKTGLEEEKVEEQLVQLVSRVQQAAQQGKSFQIEGFGTFSVKDDALHFEPAQTLETEINYKYAGMRPIELIGAFKETPSAAEESAPDRPVAGGVSGAEHSVAEAPGAGKSDGTPAAEDTPPAEKAGGGPEVKPEELAEPEPQEMAETDTQEPADAPAGEEAARKNDPMGMIVVACVILLVVGVGGWAIYDFGLISGSGPGALPDAQREQTVESASDPQARQGQQEESAPGQQLAEPGADATEGQQENMAPRNEQQGNTEASSSVYGLMGEVNPAGNNGYTIVVHSLGSRSKAQARQSDLAAAGFRALLASAVVNGETYWRVGLGQFETIADAHEATSELPEQFRNNHFIKRIQ